jgi:hypothetical protein
VTTVPANRSANPPSESQRDVVFTPFMLRVRAALEEPAHRPPRLRLSSLRPVAAATDEWFYLRCRSEQLIAEANAMLTGRSGLDLDDEVGTGRLAFVLTCRGRRARLSMGQAGRQAWVELDRSYEPSHQPVEPVDPEALEDLVVELLGPPVEEEQP